MPKLLAQRAVAEGCEGVGRPFFLLAEPPTIKRWSLDARSEEQSAYSLWGSWEIRKALAHPPLMRTTMIYTHVLHQEPAGVRSPLDGM